jgi:hypothetical protein
MLLSCDESERISRRKLKKVPDTHSAKLVP